MAAVELARLPVEAQLTVVNPSSRARVSATETTRSLKESVGMLTPSFLMYRLLRPRRLARLPAFSKGVKPVPTSIGSPSMGRKSR